MAATEEVDLAQLLGEEDQADEALTRYKESLLGSLDSSAAIIDADDPRLVFVDWVVIRPDSHSDGPYFDEIVLDLSKLNKDTVAFTIVEGARYEIDVEFRVQKEVVTGLRYTQHLSRDGTRVATNTSMMGSFSPKGNDAYRFNFEGLVIPSGAEARGTYSAKAMIFDDDKNVYMDVEYQFTVAAERAAAAI